MNLFFYSFRTAHQNFWTEHPALALGISALLSAFIYCEHSIVIAFFWLFYLGFLFLKKVLPHAVFIITMALFCHFLYDPLPPSSPGKAYFSIHSIDTYTSPFQSGWIVRGEIHALMTENGSTSLHLPCSAVFIGKRPVADCDYIFTGRLRQIDSLDYTFHAKKWDRVEKTWSLAEWRYKAKQKVRKILSQHISHPQTVSFLSAIFTGDIDNRLLRFFFGKLGLQYILVISGFHFAILASFVAFALRYVVSAQKRTYFLLIGITLYYLFVGNSPPVLRSFLAAFLFLIGKLLQRPVSGLNILGATMLIEITLNPLIVRNIGFQLSFLCCLGILLLFSPLKVGLRRFFPSRTRLEVAELSLSQQAAYLLSSFFSKALGLTLSVNIALFPILLFHFHRFPYLSLIYNLFVPLGTALSLFLLLSSLTLFILFPLFSLPLFFLTDQVARSLLELISHPPAVLDYGLSLAPSAHWVTLHIVILLISSISLRKREI